MPEPLPLADELKNPAGGERGISGNDPLQKSPDMDVKNFWDTIYVEVSKDDAAPFRSAKDGKCSANISEHQITLFSIERRPLW